MRVFKFIVNAFLILVALPVTIVGILGMLMSPFQTVARATEPQEMLQVSDLMLSETVEDQAQQALSEGNSDADGSSQTVQAAYETQPVPTEPNVAEAVQGDEYMAEPIQGETYEGEATQGNGVQADVYAVEPVQVMGGYYSSEQLRDLGIISDGKVDYTWYSQRVLPGEGLEIEGRHISDEGYVVDGQDRIVVASSDLPYGTELNVPFGSGTAVVLDTGCAPGIVDVYTDF